MNALTYRPSWWLRLRRWFAAIDNGLLIDNRRTAQHNVDTARKRLAIAQVDLAHYEKELRQVDEARRINDRTIRDDTLVLAQRGAR